MVNKLFHCLDILAITSGATEQLLRQLLRERDAEGKTPLQLACAADKPDVVLAMLSAGTSMWIANVLCRSGSDFPVWRIRDILVRIRTLGSDLDVKR